MKLELKHLAPYLPYRISVKWFRPDDNSFHTSDLTISDYNFLTSKMMKPILRPLSDLTKDEFKELGLNMDWHCLDDWIKEQYLMTVKEYSYLLKKHFDVFGLIEKGLAIDINTLYK